MFVEIFAVLYYTLLAEELKCHRCSQQSCSKPAGETSSLSCCRQCLWWIVLYLFYSFNIDFFHSPQMAPESTVCVPKEIPNSFFFPSSSSKRKKAHILFVCYGLLWDTTHNLTLFSPSMDNLFTGWRGDGLGKKELLSCFLAMILSTTISFLTSYSLFINSPCTLTIVLLPQLHWLYFSNFSHFGAWNQCGLFSYMVTWNSL